MKRDRLIGAGCALASLAIVWLAWEWMGRQSWNIARVFPPPTKFVSKIYESDFKVGIGSQSATLSQSIVSSVFRVFAGLAIGFAAALVVGFLIGLSTWFKRFVMPVIQVLAPIAPIAWIPLALVLFGIGNQTAIFIVFMGVFFTLTIAAAQAIETVPKHLLDAAATLGASRVQVLAYVVLPHILPTVFTILRLNFIAAWMAVLAAEMTGLRDGLGAIVMIGRNLFDNNLILFGMCLIGITGFLGDVALRGVQRTFFWWDGK